MQRGVTYVTRDLLGELFLAAAQRQRQVTANRCETIERAVAVKLDGIVRDFDHLRHTGCDVSVAWV